MGLFVEAILDSETSTLVRNQPIQVFKAGTNELATVWSYNPTTGDRVDLVQPLSTDATGTLEFAANPGFYELSRGTTRRLIEVSGTTFTVEEVTRVPLTNFSSEFLPNDYSGVIFHRAYMPSQQLGASTTISGPFPEPCIYYYAGSSNITVTYAAELMNPFQQDQFIQLGTGSITIGVTAPVTRANAYGHTKTAGQNTMLLVTQVGAVDAPKLLIAGQTA